VLLDVLKEFDGALQLPSIDGLRSLAGVLERHSQVRSSSPRRLVGRNLCRSVADHLVVVMDRYLGGVVGVVGGDFPDFQREVRKISLARRMRAMCAVALAVLA